MNIIKNIEKLFIIIMSIILVDMVFEIWWSYPSNHGGGFYSYLIPTLISMILGITNILLFKGSKTLFLLSIICLVLIFISDCFNLYVNYDVWLMRGMPNFGEYTITIIQEE